MRANYLLLLAATAVQAAPFIKRYENTTAPASQLSTSLADGSLPFLVLHHPVLKKMKPSLPLSFNMLLSLLLTPLTFLPPTL